MRWRRFVNPPVQHDHVADLGFVDLESVGFVGPGRLKADKVYRRYLTDVRQLHVSQIQAHCRTMLGDYWEEV